MNGAVIAYRTIAGLEEVPHWLWTEVTGQMVFCSPVFFGKIERLVHGDSSFLVSQSRVSKIQRPTESAHDPLSKSRPSHCERSRTDSYFTPGYEYEEDVAVEESKSRVNCPLF